MKKFIVILLSFPLVLTGCSDKVIIPPELIKTGGATFQNLNGAVSTASVVKELSWGKIRRNFDKEYGKAYSNSGFRMQFAMQEINGVQVYLPTQISFRELPQFQPMTTGPSVHPVWGTVKEVGREVIRYGVIGLGIHEVIGGYKALTDKVGNQYHGPVQMTGSYNTAGRDNYVTANGLKMNQGHRDHSSGCSNGNCEQSQTHEFNLQECLDNPPGGYNTNHDPLWRASGCSCTSHADGQC